MGRLPEPRPACRSEGPPHSLCYHESLRIGIHTSIAGSLEKAALQALELGANTFQIFSASPRMWRAAPLDPVEVKRLRAARERLGLWPLAVHDNYLVNLASAVPALREQSVASFRGEIERAIAIGAEYLVAHPGNYRGRTLEEGIRAAIESMARAAHGIKAKSLVLLIENTVGAGAQLGGCFEELKVMRELSARFVDLEVGFCLDTAHCLACGYDIATPEGLRATVKLAGEVLGLANVRLIHANDSKTPLGSHVDRHEHIGKGHIGKEGFRRMLSHPKLRGKPFICETPRDRPGDDRRNVQALIELCRKRVLGRQSN